MIGHGRGRYPPRRSGLLSLCFIVALGVALGVVAGRAFAEDPCTKLPDLWFPAPGTALANHGISVQEATASVCQGGTIRVTITVDNLTCGDAGPFDVALYYDSIAAGRLIGTQHVEGLKGCEYVTLTYSWNTSSVNPGWHSLIAWADAAEVVVELSELNNQYTLPEEVLVSPNAALIEASKTFQDTNGGYPSPKDRIVYTIVLRNDGCADQKDNPGHELVDAFPVGMVPTGSVTATSGKAALDGTNIVWDGAIRAGGTVTITFEVTIDPDVEDLTQICNQAIVSWDSNRDGKNDSEEPSDDPSTAGLDDDPTCLTVQVPLAFAPVAGTIDAPSLSEWGAIALGVLLAAGFVGMLVRRRRLTAQARRAE